MSAFSLCSLEKGDEKGTGTGTGTEVQRAPPTPDTQGIPPNGELPEGELDAPPPPGARRSSNPDARSFPRAAGRPRAPKLARVAVGAFQRMKVDVDGYSTTQIDRPFTRDIRPWPKSARRGRTTSGRDRV